MSKKVIDIFTVVDGVLTLNREEIRGVPQFRALLERDKGSKGDADGRKKLMAFKDFYYMWLMYSFNSLVAGINSDKERHTKALRYLGLNPEIEDIDLKNDIILLDAIKVYKETFLLKNPKIKVLLTSQRGLFTIDKSLQIMVDTVNDLVDSIQLRRNKVNKSDQDLLEISAFTSTMIKQVNNFLDLQKVIPKAIDEVDKLVEELYYAEKEDTGKGKRGGDEIGERESPNHVKQLVENYEESLVNFDED